MAQNPCIILSTPLMHQQELKATVSHKGITVLLPEHVRCKSRYPQNGKLIICPSGKIIEKPKAERKEKKKAAPLPPINNIEKNSTPEDTNLQKVIHKKEFSVNKKRVPEIIFAAVNAQNHACKYPRLYFITVTFPPCISETMGYQLLNTWLTRIRKELGKNNKG